MPRSYRDRRKAAIRTAKYYYRWMTIRKRQLQLERSARSATSGRYGLAPVWMLENDDGYHNFHAWIESQLKQHPEIDPERFHVQRRDKSKQFSPENCYLKPATTARVLVDHSAELVQVPISPALVSIRRFTGWMGAKLEHHRALIVEVLAPPENCPMAQLETLFHLR